MVKLGVPNRTLKKWWPRTLRTSRADLISKADDPLPHQSTTNLLAIWLVSPPKTKTIINSRCLFGWSSLEWVSQKSIYSHVFFFLDEVATLRLFPNIAGWKIPPFLCRKYHLVSDQCWWFKSPKISQPPSFHLVEI